MGIDNEGVRLLLEGLVKSQESMSEKMGTLYDRMGDLVSIEAARVEREVNQSVKNKEVADFIKLNEEPLIRVRRWQKVMDSSIAKVVAAAVLAACAISANNFLT